MNRALPFALALGIVSAPVVGCEEDDPSTMPSPDSGPRSEAGTPDSGPETDTGPRDTGTMDTGAGDTGAGDTGAPDMGLPPPVCEHAATDFDLSDTEGDGWPACSADDGSFDLFGTSVSTFARVAAFEQIADLLWRRTGAPSADDFLTAREVYSVDQGIGSRVSRRFDAHYPECSVAEPAMTNECQRPGAAEACPDRCVGPALLQPMLVEAFMAGGSGADPELNAARIEGALLRFLFVSAYKEGATCGGAIADCDSGIAYYRGDSGLAADGTSLSRTTDPASTKGIARYVLEADPEADVAVMESHLAMRCWREMDNPAGEATNDALREQALGQLDRALVHALAVVLRARIDAFAAATGTARAAHWELLRVAGPEIVREATVRDAAMGAAIAAELAKTDPASVDATALGGAIAALFPCAY